MYKSVSLILVALVPQFALCANILAVIPSASYSHQIALRSLWRELSLRGHKLTLISPDPINDKKLSNLTEIDTHFMYEIIKADESFFGLTANKLTIWNTRSSMLSFFSETAKHTLADRRVQKLIGGEGFKFDVVLLESFHPEMLAFGKVYNCPTIIVCSLDVEPYFHHSMGNPSHPLLHLDYVSPFFGRLDFLERLKSVTYSLYLAYFEKYVELPEKETNLRTYFPNVTETITDLLRDIDMLFVYANPVFLGARSFGPATIDISGGRHISPVKGVPKDLQEFLDRTKNGFVYFSLGTNVKSSQLEPERLEALKDTIKKIPYQFLWKFDADMPGKPENVKLIKWVQQNYVLSHPNIKLFITQGGLQSIEEAVENHVPMVVIPCFADQERNAKIVKARGIGKVVSPDMIVHKGKLRDDILEVINNSSYKEAIRKFHQVSTDWPMTGLERAVWWTEYVIRHKGAKHLRNPVADLPAYQYFLLDVIGFISLVMIAAFILVFMTIKYIVSLQKSNHKRADETKKRK
ncbi:hypothetical protein NQ318_021869 [Aromia moschata]|uniref:UDP-glucuronosyltransferase n=1 Tax=Aromia moschata TaxID=1265417 RepID=A0AAV8Z5Z2_9CUCU|nr:hypothetical protein NQ318_021869 [Aromia moschata]